MSLEWSALLLLIGCLIFIAGSSLWGRECLHIKWSAVHCSIGQRLVYSVSMATLSPNQIFQLACQNYCVLLNANWNNFCNPRKSKLAPCYQLANLAVPEHLTQPYLFIYFFEQCVCTDYSLLLFSVNKACQCHIDFNCRNQNNTGAVTLLHFNFRLLDRCSLALACTVRADNWQQTLIEFRVGKSGNLD